MFVNEKDPYAALFAGLVFLTLPFALAVHDAFALAFGRAGLLVSVSAGVAGWDGTVWFVFGVFAFLNLVVSAGLTKLAYKKMMRRHSRYALFLSGVAACAAAAVAWIFELLLGSGALGGLRGEAVLEYAFAVWLVAMLTLPKRLTRAPVQPVVFHRKK
ncbi:TPA: hypothetical protein ACFPBL_000534 [Neisseria meningitidis]|uniref:hypothetical protein n=1 Tax=Neisseria meningitidis TaxID=487 RepID=UPI000E592CB2|nr:hypothetical protein [Neisseria meningitidis]MCZ2317796.1 hypothetical protein [Neisseria meningitidis]